MTFAIDHVGRMPVSAISAHGCDHEKSAKNRRIFGEMRAGPVAETSEQSKPKPVNKAYYEQG